MSNYVLGHDSIELQRLIKQSEFLRAALVTERIYASLQRL